MRSLAGADEFCTKAGRQSSPPAFMTCGERSGDRLESRLEEAQVFGLVNHLQAAYLVAACVDVDDRLRNNIHVRLRVDAARDRQAHQLQRRPAVLAGLGIAAR